MKINKKNRIYRTMSPLVKKNKNHHILYLICKKLYSFSYLYETRLFLTKKITYEKDSFIDRSLNAAGLL